MQTDEGVLYERFADARRAALEVTDHYRGVYANDPHRAELWERVVHQTETARTLLESWLQSGKLAEGYSQNVYAAFTLRCGSA